MYKVKDAADQLGVSRVEIFEILLSRREEFNPYVVKNNSITYITDEGLEILKKVLFPPEEDEEIAVEIEAITSEEVEDLTAGEEIAADEEDALKAEASETVSKPVEQDENNSDYEGKATEDEGMDEPYEDDDEAALEDEAQKSIDLDEYDPSEASQWIDNENDGLGVERMSIHAIEDEEDLAGQWLKEIQQEDEQASQMDNRLRELRTQVTALRNKILVLDSEIKRKDDAIKHYHEIMKDDVSWLEDIEQKIILIAENSKNPFGDAADEMVEESSDKPAFFKLFRR